MTPRPMAPRHVVSNALYGPKPPLRYSVTVEAVTVASSEKEAKRRVAVWLASGRVGIHGWCSVRKQEEEPI